MKLLYVIHQFFPYVQSGTEQYCLAAAREARRRGDEVVILSLHYDCDTQDPPLLVFDVPYDGFRVRRLRHWRGLNANDVLRDYHNPAVAVAFAGVLAEEQPDAVHFFHLRQLGGDLIPAAKATGAKVVVSLTDFWYVCPRFTLLRSDGSLCDGPPAVPHGCAACHAPELLATPPAAARDAIVDDDRAESRLAALLQRKDRLLAQLAQADHVIAPSRFLAAKFVQNGFPAARLQVLPYGLDAGRVRRLPVERPRRPLRLGFVGVLSPWKAPHVLVEAVRSLPGEFELTLWGNDQETMFLDYIATVKARAAGDERIRFAGPFGRERIDEVFGSLDVLVVPSVWYENTPFVILEAFEAGVPVIASALGGMAEVVRDGDNGFTFAAGDVHALAALLAACRDDPARLQRLSPMPPADIAGNYERFLACYRKPPPPPARRPTFALLLLPFAAALALLLLLVTLLLDLVCTPFVWLRRRPPPPDQPPPTRNASIIVLNWNGIGYLRELLPSLRVAVDRCPGDHEVIVVDNGSDDGSAEFCAREHPWARVVRLPENRFFIRGNAAGVAAATRDVLVFVNNDMRVEPDFLVRLLEPFGPPDLFATTARIEMQGGAETGCTRLAPKRGALRPYQAHSDQAGPVPAMWAGGGSSAFDRTKYLELGGFEGLYEPCYAEDLSLSYQAWQRGWRVEYVGRAVVHHAFRGTSKRVFGNRRVERLDRRNRELFFWRSIQSPRLLLLHAVLLPWNLLKAARRSGLGLGLELDALLRALPRLPSALLARERSRLHRRRSDQQILALANDVGAYRRAFHGDGAGEGERKQPRILCLATTGMPPAAAPGLQLHHHVLPPAVALRRPVEDLFARIPRRLWASAGDGPRREAARHLLAEVDHDVVWCADLDSYAAAAPHAQRPVVVHFAAFTPAWLPSERRRERRWLRRLGGSAAQIVCDDAATAAALTPWLGREPTVLDRSDAAAVTELLAAVEVE